MSTELSRHIIVWAAGLTLLSGCGSPRPPTAPVGPSDPFAVKTAACVSPETGGAFLLVDSLSLTNGHYRVVFAGACDGVDLPSGAFGRPATGSVNILWRGVSPTATWTLSAAPVRMMVEGNPELVASVEITAIPRSTRPTGVVVEARLMPTTPYLAPFEGATDTLQHLTWSERKSASPVALGPRLAEGPVLSLAACASSDYPARWRFVFAGSARVASALPEVLRRSHQQCLRAADEDWHGLRRQGASLRISDPEVESAIEDALLVLFGCTERVDGRLRSLGNPFQYRDTWVRDAARQVSALAQWGAAPTARELAEDLLEFQSDDGDFMSQPGQLDATGEAVWALGEAFGRGDSAPIPLRVRDAVARAWRWCEWERLLVRKRAPAFAGLMPPADPRDNELAAGYLFGTDSWTLAGYTAGASLLARSGVAAIADSMRESAAEYQAILGRRVSSGTTIPAAWVGRARDWGNYSALYPTGAVEIPFAARLDLLSRLESNESARGLATYGAADSLHAYLGADLAVDALALVRADLWHAALEALLHWRTGTGGSPEVFSRANRSFGANFPPHATAAAALLVLVRQGLVSDVFGDTLRVTSGTRASWWHPGGELLGCGTRFGRFDLQFQREGRRARWRWTPVPVWVEVHLPPGTRFASATDKRVIRKDDVRVLVPPGISGVEVECVSD